MFHLADALEQGAVGLSFYRGGWCPYCNLELQALQQALPEIQSLGAQLVAVSPETPDNSLSTAEKHSLAFTVLSDQGNRVAKDFGIVFTLPEALRPVYAQFGIDLPAWNGDDSFELPMPATYVIGRNGIILDGFVNTDYTQRMEPERILDILRTH
ncbi:MAG: peroxiredoxin-like family protein [Mariprofundaceae bacterium]|nr:peroxiredoxin-like family protein [Mariprofundaceae bacterium]